MASVIEAAPWFVELQRHKPVLFGASGVLARAELLAGRRAPARVRAGRALSHGYAVHAFQPAAVLGVRRAVSASRCGHIRRPLVMQMDSKSDAACAGRSPRCAPRDGRARPATVRCSAARRRRSAKAAGSSIRRGWDGDDGAAKAAQILRSMISFGDHGEAADLRFVPMPLEDQRAAAVRDG